MVDDYKRDLDALLSMERYLVESLRELTGPMDPVVAVIAASDSPAASIVRALEYEAFPGYDFAVAMEPYEATSRFILTIDLEAAAVAHCKRVVTTSVGLRSGHTGLTGIEIVDDRLTARKPEESLGIELMLKHHGITSLRELMNVTTTFATRRAGRPRKDRPYTLVSYKAVFELTRLFGNRFVIAYLNGLSRASLGRLGVEWELLAGRPFHLPCPGSDEYDLAYEAVVIPDSPHNVELFDALAAWKVPMCWMAADGQMNLSHAAHG